MAAKYFRGPVGAAYFLRFLLLSRSLPTKEQKRWADALVDALKDKPADRPPVDAKLRREHPAMRNITGWHHLGPGHDDAGSADCACQFIVDRIEIRGPKRTKPRSGGRWTASVVLIFERFTQSLFHVVLPMNPRATGSQIEWTLLARARRAVAWSQFEPTAPPVLIFLNRRQPVPQRSDAWCRRLEAEMRCEAIFINPRGADDLRDDESFDQRDDKSWTAFDAAKLRGQGLKVKYPDYGAELIDTSLWTCTAARVGSVCGPPFEVPHATRANFERHLRELAALTSGRLAIPYTGASNPPSWRPITRRRHKTPVTRG